jgi:hypothetical protein
MRDSGPLHWMLRIACAAEFVGHGAFGIMTKPAWLPYFSVAGIPPEWAWKMMPLIGGVDITLGLFTLVRPTRVFRPAAHRPASAQVVETTRDPRWTDVTGRAASAGSGRGTGRARRVRRNPR